MLVTIYHAAPDFKFANGRSSFSYWGVDSEKEQIKQELHLEALGKYPEVATIEVDTTDVQKALGLAYQFANHIESDWSENEGVTLYVDSVRSSSVGDVFELNDEVYIIAGFGFDKLQ